MIVWVEGAAEVVVRVLFVSWWRCIHLLWVVLLVVVAHVLVSGWWWLIVQLRIWTTWVEGWRGAVGVEGWR